ncbi:hypothetical protein BGW36DRAFT_382536 [Talaromyces proteolyticus]|uniref:RNA helicase HEL117 n=1 Tax=Talaromyces proteolyticus TaxID=1131652 RepID=A0AAD4KLG7_9EURO|nr:uncharacterized protein BGW36DRAFT_382536 [Talaromyces proteolyticus]KAH8695359.1 hypothetical protein BGW36DRAFT_382536 [Talaromyces proteolyticus]
MKPQIDTPGLDGRGKRVRSRSRSISPPSQSRSDLRDGARKRGRSDSNEFSRDTKARRHRHHHEHNSNRRRHKDLSPVSAAPPVLPYNARQLSKGEFSRFEPMFAMYLDIQKGMVLEDLSEKEMKGRWKSFIKRWNRGELAEGWYDPSTFEKASSSRSAERSHGRFAKREANLPEQSDDHGVGSPEERSLQIENDNDEDDEEEEEEEEEEEYGPKLSNLTISSRNKRSGPTIPNLQDLELQRENTLEDAVFARSTALTRHKEELNSHKNHLRTIEDEVAPRAEPGTHERKMEKKREKAAANREFAAGKRGGSPSMDAAPDSELLGGGGDDDLETLKRAKEQEKKKKNEREIRREEIMRARRAEREERLTEYRKKEEETMGWLKALAKQRFG